MKKHDPRVTPARKDIAARSLRGKVTARRFVSGTRHVVGTPATPLRSAPCATAPLLTELLRGEEFVVYQNKDGWAWGQSQTDKYVGYTPAANLRSPVARATHLVLLRVAPMYHSPAVKANVAEVAYVGSRVHLTGEVDGKFARTADGWWMLQSHLIPLAGEPDLAATRIQSFIGIPYVYGGRTPLGIDCSALVQLVFAGMGVRMPRDSDQQLLAPGRSVPHTKKALFELKPPQFGELIFWRGHVALVLNEQWLIHANAHHMQVTMEDCKEVWERHQRMGLNVIGRRQVRGITYYF